MGNLYEKAKIGLLRILVSKDNARPLLGATAGLSGLISWDIGIMAITTRSMAELLVNLSRDYGNLSAPDYGEINRRQLKV